MKRALYIFCLLCAFISCRKSVLVSTGIDLGEKVVDECEGCFPVMVDTEGAWYASSGSYWIEVDGAYHNGKSSFSVKYDNNLSYEGACRLARSGMVRVITCDGATVAQLHILQKGKTPVFSFPEETAISADGGGCSVPCITDLPSEGAAGLNLTTDAAWISKLQWGADGRSVTFDAEGGTGRSAVISLSHTDLLGTRTDVEFKVCQR